MCISRGMRIDIMRHRTHVFEPKAHQLALTAIQIAKQTCFLVKRRIDCVVLYCFIKSFLGFINIYMLKYLVMMSLGLLETNTT